MEQAGNEIGTQELPAQFAEHLRKQVLLAAGLVVFSLVIGIIGFKASKPHDGWTDAYLNAAMLLGGMGPIGEAKELSQAAKFFEASYALYCGLVFVAVLGIMLAPFVNRVISRLEAIHLHITRKASSEVQQG